jgi:AcrR family transcriptional regulator
MARTSTARTEPRRRVRGGKPHKSQRKFEQRRQQIFSGALACFERKGYHETSINDIAEAAGISSGLIYQYFNDKRDLLFQVILEILEAYNRDVPKALVGIKDPITRFQAASIAYYRVIDHRISATLFAYRESKSLDPDQIKILKTKELQTNQMLVDCIQDCVNAGYFATPNAELASYWIVTTAHAWGLKNWRLRKIVSFEDYTRQTLNLLMNGMLTNLGRSHLMGHDLLDGRPL